MSKSAGQLSQTGSGSMSPINLKKKLVDYEDDSLILEAQSTQQKKVKSDDGKYSDKSEKSKQNSANIATNSNRF